MVELREFTPEEVRVNNGQNGARVWIVLWGAVYDVTDYMDSHPGGPELIGEYAGTDATSGFDDYGHSSDAKKMLKKYEIGRLVKDAKGKAVKIDEGNGGASVKNSRQRRKFLSVILGPCAST